MAISENTNDNRSSLKVFILAVASLLLIGFWLNQVAYAALDQASEEAAASELQSGQGGDDQIIPTDSNQAAAADADPNRIVLNNSAEFNTLGGKEEALEPKQVAYFQVSGEEHSVTVNEYDEESAQVTIASDPFDATLQRDEPQSFDVNDDATPDIEVTYLGPIENRANFRFAQVNAEATATTDDTGAEEKQESSGGINRTWIIAGGAAFIVVLFLGLYNRQNSGRRRR